MKLEKFQNATGNVWSRNNKPDRTRSWIIKADVQDGTSTIFNETKTNKAES